MKKMMAICLCMVLLLGLAACSGFSNSSGMPQGDGTGDFEIRVAMIGDYANINDQAFNQNTHEGCKEWAKENGVDYSYYKPPTNSDDDRIITTEKAIEEGYTVIVLPGYAFKKTIQDLAPKYSMIRFIGIDLRESDFDRDFKLPKNVHCSGYREEIGGYMAGYAAVKLGYTRLGFLGGMPIPGVERYGYGFVQGVDAAAKEENLSDVDIRYTYGNRFDGDQKITEVMKGWFSGGTQIVFPCGGSIYTSAGEAAKKEGGHLIGVDTDQSDAIDGKYGEGMTVTSVIKDLNATIKHSLESLKDGTFQGGTFEVLGLDSDHMDGNYIHLPEDTTQWNDAYTKKDYAALLADIYNGKVEISDDITKKPGDFASVIRLEYCGSIE